MAYGSKFTQLGHRTWAWHPNAKGGGSSNDPPPSRPVDLID